MRAAPIRWSVVVPPMGLAAATMLHGVVARLTLWLQIWRERQALARLDPRMLDDLGLTEDDVRREVGRPFWDVPAERSRLPH